MHTVSRARISFRTLTRLWQSPQRFAELLAFFEQYRDTLDEVAFFTGYTHTPLPEDELLRRAETLSRLIPQVKALGLSAGINHLATLGHLDENLDYSLRMPWQRLMNIHGVLEGGNYCPADPELQAYTTRTYTALAQTGAEFIWIDDDVRLEGRMTVAHACFCDRCLARFAEETGQAWTREALHAAFNTGEGRLSVRTQWLAHNRKLLAELLAGIRATVDTVNPALPLGLMTGESFYSGNAFDTWADALSGTTNAPQKWRPGGGFYTDAIPAGCLDKAHAIGRMTAQLPLSITDVQSEHENFPYQFLNKSKAAFTAEIAAYIGAGCTGTALNCMGLTGDPFDEYLPYFDAVAARREFYDTLAATFGRSRCEGAWLGITPEHYATQQMDGDWLTTSAWISGGPVTELSEIGLPLAYAREDSALTLLVGDACLGFSREELQQLLAGSVLLDGRALQRLHELGLGELTGFDIAGTRTDDTVEIFTADALNERFAGWRRDCRQSFKWWAQQAYLLNPLAPAARILSTAVDFGEQPHGNLSGVFENALGGRVAVRGFFPWSLLQWLSSSAQMKSLCRWLSRDTLPAYVASYHKAALWCRRDEKGRPAMLLLNPSLDPAEDIELNLLGHWQALSCMRYDGLCSMMHPAGTDGPYTCFSLPEIVPWDAVLLTVW